MMWWHALHFLRPHWLWLMAAAPVLYVAMYLRGNARARWSRYIQSDLLDHLMVKRRWHLRLRPIHLTCLFILLASIAIAGPTWKREQPPFTEDKAPLVIALDLSETMNAIDLNPTRLERAKLKVRDLLKVRNGGRTALYVYAGSAHMVLPFTTDFSLFDLYLDSLSTSLMPISKKDTTSAIHALEDFLKDEPTPGTVLFVTDGIEPQAYTPLRKFIAANENKNDVLVMGVGTSAGAPIRTSKNQFLIEGGRRVFSKLDVNALRSLKNLGAEATTLTLNDDDIQWVQRRVQHHLEVIQQKDSKTRWIDEGYWLTLPIVVIALFWSRKGWTVRWTSGALAAVMFIPSPDGQSRFSWADLFLTHDQQGRYYYEHGSI